MRSAVLTVVVVLCVACGPGISYHPVIGSGGGGDTSSDSGTGSGGGNHDGGGGGQTDYKLIKACYGQTCSRDLDCPQLACNSVTGHCFEGLAVCPNFPCAREADCPSVSCNTATGICNP